MLKAILFDVDGTLAETEEYHRRAFNAAFAQCGHEAQWSPDQYRELLRITGGKERLRAYFRAHGAAVDDAQIAQLHAAKNVLYAQGVAAGAARLRPGVQRLMLEAQRAGVRLGIATTTSEVNLDALLRPLLGEQWSRAFSCVVAGDQVAHKKPAPDVYQACLARLQIAAGEAVAIEDSVAGVRAARAAGIAVVATPSQYTDTDDFSQADCLLPHLGEPDMPWEQLPPGFTQRRLQLADLQRLVSTAGTARGEGVTQRRAMVQ